MRNILLQYEKRLELIFKICYLILVLCTFNTYLYNSFVQPVFVKITLMLGMFLIMLRLFACKKFIKMPCVILMVLFCVSFVVSTVMNRDYGMIENGKWVIWTGIQFFALYVCDIERSMESYMKEFKLAAHIMMGYSAVASCVSLGMLLTSYSEFFETAEGEFLISGFTWGRLWGVYTDPNYGAVFSVISILISITFVIKRQGIYKLLYILCIVLNYLYVVFSDSRTGELALVIGQAIFVFFVSNKILSNKSTLFRYGVVLCTIIALGGGTLAGVRIIKKGYNEVLAPSFTKIDVKKEQKKTNEQNEEKKDQIRRELGRKQDLEEDVSNGRFELWGSAVEVWKTSPIYGVGYSTFIPYAKEHTPNTYAVNNNVGEYSSMHNAFMNTLVYQGAAGFVILLILSCYMAWYVVVPIYKGTDEKYWYLSSMLASVAAVVVSMMFLLEGMYTLSPGSFVLWGFSGYMVRYAYEIRKGSK
jgi:hypothetical protein